MDNLNLFLLVVLGASPIVLFFFRKLTHQKIETACRLSELRSNFECASKALDEWVRNRDFFESSDSEYQRLLRVKIFHLKQLVFFKGKPTLTEKMYLAKLQNMQTPPREWSD